MTNTERIQAHNAELREAIEMAEKLPEAGGEVVEPVIKPLEVTENGTYTAPDGVNGYSPVSVNVPIPDGYIIPTGTKEITENGTHDAKVYESVNVNVPIPDGYIVPSGSQEITANGSYDVTDKAGVVVAVPEREIVLQDKEITVNGTYSADDGYDGLGAVSVNVPIPDGYIKPSGELEVTENGTHDVTAYASVNVNVPTGGGSSDLPAGYRRVDYIQFTGKQIVDMQIVGNQNTSIQIVFTRERSTQHYLFGAASSGNTASITGYMGGSWRYGNKYATKNPITAADMIYSGTMDNSQVTITGSKTAISGVNDFETVGSLLLGACRNSDGTLGAPQFIGKVLFAAAGQGGELVQKLVAVTDGTVFRFWDAIGKKFHDSITDTPLGGGNF